MDEAAPFITAVLDANVLYPISVRNNLLNLAEAGLFDPIWSREIHEEWMRNLLENRPDIKRVQLEKTCKAMNKAFPGATVRSLPGIIGGLILPDPDDRHVLAAAIKGQAQVIITNNLKDFPAATLAAYNVRAQHPDQFVLSCIERHPEKCAQAVLTEVAVLKNPPMTVGQVLESLERNGLKNSVAKLRSILK